MYVKVHGTSDYVQGNSQSCQELVNYLGKENEGKELMDKEFFFNQQNDILTDNHVIQTIDNNRKGLKNMMPNFICYP